MTAGETGQGDSRSQSGIRYLDGRRLDRALRAGILRLLSERGYLNKINVFPVPDGDTGTNLALTMTSIAQSLAARPCRSVGELLAQVADAALDGARGNSGAIMAQFLQGLADSTGGRERIGIEEIAAALETANSYAHDAIDQPLEGTILSVTAEVADEARSMVERDITDLAVFMRQLVARAQAAVERTRNGLEAMRRANVVDAGAQGFVLLLEGIATDLDEGSPRQLPQPDIVIEDSAAEMAGQTPAGDIAFRYCTECMLTGDGVDRRRLREELSLLGNSMVIAGTRRKLKIHIHSDEPQQVFDICARFGVVSATKADDMRQQTRTIAGAIARVAVVTDSAADLPDAAYEDLGIHFVPLRVNFGDRSFMDKVSMRPEEFFAELRRNPVHPQTSQPAPGDFRRVYEFLASHFPEVISISVTGAASGTWQAALSAAQRVQGGKVVRVIDSRNVSVGQGLITSYAAECARGGWQGERLATAIDMAIRRTRVYAVVPDLSWAVRGGRVKGWLKAALDRLGLAPIFRLDRAGRLVTRGLARRAGDLTAALAGYVLRRNPAGHGYRISIAHAARAAEAQRLRTMLQAKLPGAPPISLVEASAVMSAHGGPGTLIVALQDELPVPGPSGS